jgi:hypothetical protein
MLVSCRLGLASAGAALTLATAVLAWGSTPPADAASGVGSPRQGDRAPGNCIGSVVDGAIELHAVVHDKDKPRLQVAPAIPK